MDAERYRITHSMLPNDAEIDDAADVQGTPTRHSSIQAVRTEFRDRDWNFDCTATGIR